MAPKPASRRRHYSKTPHAATSPAPRAPRPHAEAAGNASPVIPVARRQACVSALSAKGYDRALAAHNELAHAHRDELDNVYRKHSHDQHALGVALARLCHTHRISYTSKHYHATKGTAASADPSPGTKKGPKDATTSENYISLDQTNWSVDVTLHPIKEHDKDATYKPGISLHGPEDGERLLRQLRR